MLTIQQANRRLAERQAKRLADYSAQLASGIPTPLPPPPTSKELETQRDTTPQEFLPFLEAQILAAQYRETPKGQEEYLAQVAANDVALLAEMQAYIDRPKDTRPRSVEEAKQQAQVGLALNTKRRLDAVISGKIERPEPVAVAVLEQARDTAIAAVAQAVADNLPQAEIDFKQFFADSAVKQIEQAAYALTKAGIAEQAAKDAETLAGLKQLLMDKGLIVTKDASPEELAKQEYELKKLGALTKTKIDVADVAAVDVVAIKE